MPQKELKTLTLKKLQKQEIKLISTHEGTVKIKDYKPHHFADLMKSLLKLAKFIGITEPPDNEVLQMLAEFLSEFWGDFSKEEIKQAFDYAILDDKNTLTHYNRLTPQLISSVLTTHKKKRSKALIKFTKEYEDIAYNFIRNLKIQQEKEEEKEGNNWQITK